MNTFTRHNPPGSIHMRPVGVVERATLRGRIPAGRVTHWRFLCGGVDLLLAS
jgi:hypothetical protein